MDVMMRLPSSSLDILRTKFRDCGNGDGLTLEQFVSTMLTYLPRESSQEETLQLVIELVELFTQIDVNGDATLEWEEFTSHCIEAGMLATRKVDKPLTEHFQMNKDYKDRSSHHMVTEMKYIETLGAVIVVEANSATVSILSSKTFKLVRKLHIGVDDESSPVICVEYAPDLNILIVCSTDLSMTFWTWDDLKLLGRTKTKSIRKIFYSSTSTLYTTDDTGLILMWQLRVKPFAGKSTCICIPRGTLNGHDGILNAFAEVTRYNTLLTGGMDAKIILWDLESGRKRAELLKHRRAVCFLEYSKTHDIVLSAGYENEIFGWDVYNKQIVLQLVGHHHPSVGIQLTFLHAEDKEEHAITCDTSGVLKLWKLHRVSTGEVHACQTFLADQKNGLFRPRRLVSCGPRKVLGASREIRLYEAVSTYVQDFLPYVVLFNDVLDRFYVVLGSYIQVYCAISGEMIEEWYHVSSSEITCMCFDDRKRKVIFGNIDGRVVVLNALNGAIMKSATLRTPENGEILTGSFSKSSAASSNTTLMRDPGVVNLHYSDRDKCLVAVVAHGIFILDEDTVDDKAEGAELPVFRAAYDVHEAQVTESAFSSSFSLIATGSADCSIRVWDFQHLRLEGECVGHQGDITSMCFAEPYALLVAADSNGSILLWSVRPHPRPYMCLARSINQMPRVNMPEGQITDLTDRRKTASVKNAVDSDNRFDTNRGSFNEKAKKTKASRRITMATPEESRQQLDLRETKISIVKKMRAVVSNAKHAKPSSSNEDPPADFGANSGHDQSSRTITLYTADKNGIIKSWDLQTLLVSLSMHPAEEAKLPPNQEGYNATRHVELSYRYLFEMESAMPKKKIELQDASKANLGRHHEQLVKQKMLEEKARIRKQEKMKEKLQRQRETAQKLISRTTARLNPLRAFSAHNDEITGFDFSVNPLSISTSSIDGNVRVWNLNGVRIANLTMSESEVKGIQTGRIKATPFRFNIDVQAKYEKKYKYAKVILNRIQETSSTCLPLEPQSPTSPSSPSSHVSKTCKVSSREDDLVTVSSTVLTERALESARNNAAARHPRVRKALLSMINTYNVREEDDFQDNDVEFDALESDVLEYAASKRLEIPMPKFTQVVGHQSLQQQHADQQLTVTSPSLSDQESSSLDGEPRKMFSTLRNDYRYFTQEVKKQRTKKSSLLDSIDTTPSPLLASALESRKRSPKGKWQKTKSPKSTVIPRIENSTMDLKLSEIQGLSSPSSTASNISCTSPSLLTLSPLTSSTPSIPQTETTHPQAEGKQRDQSKHNSAASSTRRLTILERQKVSAEQMTKNLRRGSMLQKQGTAFIDEIRNLFSKEARPNTSELVEARERRQKKVLLSQEIAEAPETEDTENNEQTSAPVRRKRLSVLEAAGVKPIVLADGEELPENLQSTSEDSPTKRVLTKATRSSMARRKSGVDGRKKSIGGPMTDKKHNIGIYSKKEILNLKITFDQIDADGSGKVDLEELMDNLDKLNIDLDGLSGMFDVIDDDHSGEISFAEMLALFMPAASPKELKEMLEFVTSKSNTLTTKPKTRPITDEERKEFEELFRFYDADGGGSISLIELFEALNKVEYKPKDQFQGDDDLIFSFEDLERITTTHGFDLDHELSPDEFVELMHEFFTMDIELV